MKRDYFKLAVSVTICQLAGIVGSFFTASSVSTWYAELNKPFFNPPNWIFSPVWISLYLLMAFSAYLIWVKGARKNWPALAVFGIQLVLNIAWSIIFFGLKNPLAAFIEMIFLWLAIILTMIYFNRVSRTAVYLLIPYLLWVSFAAVLNLYIVMLN